VAEHVAHLEHQVGDADQEQPGHGHLEGRPERHAGAEQDQQGQPDDG